MATSKTGEAFDDETSRCIGTIGKYNSRTVWSRLGRFPREALIRFAMSDGVESEFIKLEARVKGGQRGN